MKLVVKLLYDSSCSLNFLSVVVLAFRVVFTSWKCYDERVLAMVNTVAFKYL